MPTKRYSVAEARKRLPQLLRDVSRGVDVEISRRGEGVAVLVSKPRYYAMQEEKPSFRDAYESWRATVDLRKTGVDARFVRRLRDRSAGREVDLGE
jgi:prevent-host-death family protein